jgi:hypothetical protein
MRCIRCGKEVNLKGEILRDSESRSWHLRCALASLGEIQPDLIAVMNTITPFKDPDKDCRICYHHTDGDPNACFNCNAGSNYSPRYISCEEEEHKHNCDICDHALTGFSEPPCNICSACDPEARRCFYKHEWIPF